MSYIVLHKVVVWIKVWACMSSFKRGAIQKQLKESRNRKKWNIALLSLGCILSFTFKKNTFVFRPITFLACSLNPPSRARVSDGSCLVDFVTEILSDHIRQADLRASCPQRNPSPLLRSERLFRITEIAMALPASRRRQEAG